MKAPIHLILIILSMLLFLGAGVSGSWASPAVEWPWRGRLIAWGLFFYVLSELVTS